MHMRCLTHRCSVSLLNKQLSLSHFLHSLLLMHSLLLADLGKRGVPITSVRHSVRPIVL